MHWTLVARGAAASAAVWALRQSGARFCTLVHEDGTIECWQQPELAAWEVPKRDPHERRPRAPDWEPEAAAENSCRRGTAIAFIKIKAQLMAPVAVWTLRTHCAGTEWDDEAQRRASLIS
jgi:hypothetical protein